MVAKKSIRIGGASGYWGESAAATPQLLKAGGLDYIIYDYLAEITMSILARAKAKDSNAGYASDFISAVLNPNLNEIARQGVKIIANAGGVNPIACAEAARRLIQEKKLDLKVAVITGDDLSENLPNLHAIAPREMFTGDEFPPSEKIASVNAYLGAFPIARALALGADIVITGRCVDSALTLGACIHEFGWKDQDWDMLASGSLAGHILECGPQATGGNFTDWEQAGDISRIGYPIAEIDSNGSFTLTKPAGTGGIVNVGTVAEQLVYEIGDPQAYILPDVICDFSAVEIVQSGADRVTVSKATGRPAPDTYKTCLTYADGFRGGMLLSFYGAHADKKAAKFAEAAFLRAREIMRNFNAGDFSETSIEIIGAESQYGEHREITNAREVALKIAAKHQDALAIGVLLKEIVGLGLASPPGLSGFSGGRPKPSPVIRLYSFLLPKAGVNIEIHCDGVLEKFTPAPGTPFDSSIIERPADPLAPVEELTAEVPLIKLAWARSGDKGDKANIGVIARRPEYLPFIWAALSEETVEDRFSHFIENIADLKSVTRYQMPGTSAINFLIDRVLGGGGTTSIRNDPQGKGYAQLLLACPIPVSESIARSVS